MDFRERRYFSMILMRRLRATVLAFITVLAVSAYSQTFPGMGDDLTTSLGTFKIKVSSQFANLVNGCPGYDHNTQLLTSLPLFDLGMIVGRSQVTLDDIQF